MSTDCLFCKIVDKTIPANIAYDDDHVLGFHDIDPKAPVHVLLIPKTHVDSVAHCTDSTVLGQLFLAAKTLAEQLGVVKGGYRLVTNVGTHGGQSVFHLHVHLLAGRQLTWPPG